MDSGERSKPEVIVREKGVRIETLGVIIGSAILGAGAAVSIMRAMAGGVESVSMTGLLTFLFTLGLVCASIVLAVVAISLSRMAERTINQKNDDVRAVQEAVVARTNSAMKQIETSVLQISEQLSEQIADNIYDNFEMLSEEIQENLPSRDVLRADVIEAVERSLNDAMIVVQKKEDPVVAEVEREPVVDEDAPVAVAGEAQPVAVAAPVAAIKVAEEPITDEMREKIDKKYDEFKDIVLLGVANFPGVIARKIGEGHYRTEGDDLVDGVFVVKSEKVAVCTFCTSRVITDRFMGEQGDSFATFLKALVNELKKNHFTRVFMAFDGPLADDSPYAIYLNDLSRNVSAESFAQFELFEGSPDILIPELTERVSQLMDAPDVEEEEEDVPPLSFRQKLGS